MILKKQNIFDDLQQYRL
jgi:hypothetical protein